MSGRWVPVEWHWLEICTWDNPIVQLVKGWPVRCRFVYDMDES